MTEIEELLAKLKELDPETWSRVDKVLGLVVYPRSPLGHYIIQGVIQDAIAARGWFFSLTYSSADKKSDVIIRERGFAEGREIWLLLSHICTKGHAEALLAAYIAAREAEREAMTDG